MNALFLIILLISVFYSIQTKIFEKIINSKEISSGKTIIAYDKKFSALKRYLPKHGIIGFISDRNVNTTINNLPINEYYLAQFALAPLIISDSKNTKILIGNFHYRQTMEQILKEENLTILYKTSDYLVILKHSEDSK